MSVLSPKETYNNLKKKGFVDSDNRSDDHKYLDFIHEGKLVCYTKISHGNKEITGGLINKMAYQCQLDKTNFIKFAKCTLDLSGYIKILESKGVIEKKEIKYIEIGQKKIG